MRNLVLICTLLLTAFHIRAQYPGYTVLKDANTFKLAFATASQKTNSIKCDFMQEKNLSLLADKIVSKGKFWFSKESRVRMEYNQPFQYLMIINGDNIYVKDSQKENKISAKSNKLFQQINKIIIDCVNGQALESNDFTSRIFEGKENYLVELTPVNKNLKILFKNINVMVEKKSYGVTGIEMHEPSGDNTIIHFNNRQLNTIIPDALFAIH
ncbi:MAG: outer membrane lipoprotein carrier protein LolA [Bacteroidetes bacterium]|nr:outer membrane lipoprotein carrier protein LolA [Bacteroidota bacterium]